MFLISFHVCWGIILCVFFTGKIEFFLLCLNFVFFWRYENDKLTVSHDIQNKRAWAPCFSIGRADDLLHFLTPWAAFFDCLHPLILQQQFLCTGMECAFFPPNVKSSVSEFLIVFLQCFYKTALHFRFIILNCDVLFVLNIC